MFDRGGICLAIVRKGEHTFKGKPLTLVGPRLQPGDRLPGWTLLDKALAPVRLEDTPGKVRIFSVLPSLDTPVCDRQGRRFDEEAGKLGERVALYTVSRDTPFAQGRWCGATGAENMTVLSDIYDGSFGDALGVHIEEMGLLARSVFVVDAGGTIRYVEYVPEFTELPDYGRALAAVQELL
jgi:thiol peroxidase